jgi:hypothetical protein
LILVFDNREGCYLVNRFGNVTEHA